MLARSVGWTYFLGISGYAKHLSRAGNKEVSRFFCACLEIETSQSIK